MRLGLLFLGLASCEEPDVHGVSGAPSRERSGGVCFAEVVWDGDAWSVEITRDADGRLLSAIYDHGGYADLREVTWTADTATHRTWRELSDGSVVAEAEATERYVDGHIVARGDTETWSWTAEGRLDSYRRVDHEGEHAYRFAWTLDGRPASASWQVPGADNSGHESWAWSGRWLARYDRSWDGGNGWSLRWLEHDRLGRPTRGEVRWTLFDGSGTEPARWEWLKARAVSRDLGDSSDADRVGASTSTSRSTSTSTSSSRSSSRLAFAVGRPEERPRPVTLAVGGRRAPRP